MTSSNLTLHCGALKATRDDLQSVTTPQATSTWAPIPHTEIVDAVLESATNAGLTIKRELYGLSGRRDSELYGARMFGVIDFLDGTSDYGYSVGFRNSHDKSMVAGICAGARVFVGDNLAFSGDFAEKRKHTQKWGSNVTPLNPFSESTFTMPATSDGKRMIMLWF